MLLELAGFWPRFTALLYESLILLALLFIGTLLVLPFTAKAIAPGSLWFSGYLLLLVYGYFAVCWVGAGQTVGMKAWRLLLTDTAGKRITPARAALRLLLASSLAGGLLGLLWSCLDTDGLALQDRLSGTRVVRLPKANSV